MAANLINQIIRGHVYDFSSIQASVDGVTLFSSFQEINYNFSRDIGILRGNGSGIKRGRTRGEFNFEGSITLAKRDAQELIAILAALGFGGFAEAVFDIIVTYFEPSNPVPTVDTLVGCTMTNGDNAHSRSPDPLVMSFDLDMMDQLYNGISPVSVTAGGGVGGLLP